ncbi:MAG: pyridoxamine 5'-phosphate oxidase family protein [Dehalococcoidales bacterium]|nr:pyridoxamine 5'-phosphate oxidase family protein [Dehalococcoidales bacterium]
MAKLTEEMRLFLMSGRDPMTVFVGTIDKDGVPNISAKGSFIHVIDDETLAYADVYSLKTLENVRTNKQITIAAINAKTYKGYQFKGTGEVVETGTLLEEARKQNPQSKTVTKVKLSEIYLMDYGPQAGKKVG